jgi:hypothetical protein
MNLYVILRRSGWRSAEELLEAAGRSAKVADTVLVRPDPEPAEV